MFLRTFGRLVVISLMACGAAHPPPAAPDPRPRRQLAVIPVESDAFPGAARAVSAALAAARVEGTEEARVTRTSLEVVQLSIECVDPTAVCYQAIGHSLSANRLLFAQIRRGATRRKLQVTVTLFDVDAGVVTRTRARRFATEAEASAGAAALVAEVTR